MDKIIQIIAICFLKSTTKGDSLNSYHPSNQAKKLLNNKELPKSLAVSFLFLTFAPTFAGCPTRLGFWANRVWLRIYLYLWEASSCALFLTSRNQVNFKQCRNLATVDAHVVFIHDSMHEKRTIKMVCHYVL